MDNNIQLHPFVKIGIIGLLLGPVAAGFLIRDNLKRLGRKNGNAVLLFLILIVIWELVLVHTGRSLGTGTAFLNMAIVYLIMLPCFKNDDALFKENKKYPPAGKLVLYGLGLEILIIFVLTTVFLSIKF